MCENLDVLICPSQIRALEQKARSSTASSSSSSRIPRRSIQFNSTAKTEEERVHCGLREELAAERARSAGLERSNEALEARLRELGGRLEAAGETDARKEAAFQQVKRQWSLVSQRLAAEQGRSSVMLMSLTYQIPCFTVTQQVCLSRYYSVFESFEDNAA